MREARRLCLVMIVAMGLALGATGLIGLRSDGLLSTALAAEPPTTILILQHAERQDFTETDKDPELTDAGKQRAQALVHAVGNAGIAAVFSPKAKRMEHTVQPLQESLKLSELNFYEQGSLDKMLHLIKDKFKGKVVLIVGPGAHMGSGGIHDTIKGLGCTGPECEAKDSYDSLFVVTVYEPGRATAVKLRYGNPVAK